MEPSLLWLATLILKLTILATGAWLADFSLRTFNPRWRVGLWRVALFASCVLVVAAFVPPLYRWEIVRTAKVEPQPVVAKAELSTDREEESKDERLEARPTSAALDDASAPIVRIIEAEFVPLDDPSAAGSAPVRAATSSVPEETPSIGASYRDEWPAIAVLVWVGGATLGLSRLVLGAIRVRRIVARSEAVSDAALAAARRLAQTLHVALPDVRSSTDVASPVLYGSVRPTILLPRGVAEGMSDAERDAALAHELAHVAGRDAWWDLAMRLAACIAWPHPLIWRAPVAHRQACDRVSDLVAAEALGNRENYGRSLAQIALRVAKSPPGAGLAMARRADVVERVRLIASDVRAVALGRRGWLATSILGLAAIALGGFAVALTTRSVAADELQSPIELEVVVLDAKDDSPIAGAEVHALIDSTYGLNDAKVDRTQSTNEEGKVRFAYPDADSASIRFYVKKNGFASHFTDLDVQPRASFPQTRVVRLEPGTKVGGTVVFDDGTPVANAPFSILATSAETRSAGSHFRISGGTTDAQGRWEFDGIPKSDQPCSLSVDVPGSATGVSFVTITPTMDQRTVVDRRHAVQGVVRDAATGQPLAGVKVTANQGRGFMGSGTTTDEEGKFRLIGLSPRYEKGAALVASLDGYAASTAPIANGENDLDPIEFRMQPGKTIRVRVFDGDGKPLENALVRSASIDGFGLTQWRGVTDAVGEATWNDAPQRGLAITVFGEGHVPAGDVALDELSLNGGAYEIRLERALTVEGTVVDDATDEPLPQCVTTFRVLMDRQAGRPRWFPRRSTYCLNGRFELTSAHDEEPMSLMIEADGYETWTSEPLPPRNHHETFAVRLKRASKKPEPTPESKTIAGRVVGPNGEPVAGTSVRLAFPPSATKSSSDTVATRWTQLQALTDEQGRFEIEYPPFPDTEGGLQVEGDAGYGIASLVDVRRGEPIRLRGWARLEVLALSGPEPMPFERISFQSHGHPQLTFGFSGSHRYATTDEKGVAVFERVPEGRGTVSTSVMRNLEGGGGVSTNRQMLNVELKSGDSKRVQLGGVGGAVVGRIVMPPDPPMAHAWERSGFGMIASSKVEYGDTDYRRFGFQVSPDGTFRVEDVPAGTYELSVRLQGDVANNGGFDGPYIGNVEFGPFDVDAKDADAVAEPQDLGTIRGEWIDFLKSGDLLPPFVVRSVDGRVVSSVDFAGGPFVLNFWDPGHEASEATMRTLAGLRKKGPNELPIVSIAADPMVESAKRKAQANGWDWTIAGRSDGGPFRYAFDLLVSPTLFVVGADGVVQYRGTDAAEIEAVVAAKAMHEPTDIDPLVAWRTNVDDAEFASTTPVAAIVSLSSAYVGEKVLDDRPAKVVFVGADGTKIRELPTESSTPNSIVDPRRDRFYVLDVPAGCTAFDRTGRKLFALNVEFMTALDVDPQTGDLLIAVGGVEESQGWTLIFDSNGRLKSARPGGGAALKFEPNGRRIWFAGDRLRATDRDGKEVVSYPISLEGRSRYSEVSIDRRGVAWAVELSYGSGGSSDRRIRRCDENGILTSLEVFYDRGAHHRELNRWLAEVGDEMWVGVDRYEGDSKRTGRTVRLDATGKRLPDLDRSLQGAASNGDGLWAWDAGRLLRLDATGTIQQSYLLEDDLPSGATRRAAVACFPAR